MAGEESRLPAGTVTFLFTDIERSTENVSLLGDARYAELLDIHRKLLREAFVAHDGHEVGTEGDAFFVAFARAQDACAASVDAQRALETHAWPGEARLRVRMGLHTGEALVRVGEYVGHEVHRAKRISDAGHGGQILMSETTADLVGAGRALADLGPHRLKDLGEPQRIYQVLDDDLPREFPPLRSLESFRHNLPRQRSSFVGREPEIALVHQLLEAHRIVTLTGVGGCGKTRLALQVAAELIDAYPDGAFFVDLAPVSDPDDVTSAVADAVGVPRGEGGVAAGIPAPVDQVLVDFLTRRTVLVLLDNCEHLLDACAALADRILGRCPGVTILATSREALEIEGERSYRVPSLSVPHGEADAASSEAVSLFESRAEEVRPGFELTPDNVVAVVDICRRLDGIPLAIEFAASRVSHLSPREIADRIARSFRLLHGGRRRVQRQQTLEAVLDWSFDLLSESERALMRRLSVFAGSFSLRAAEGICAGDGVDRDETIDILASLVAKSLVTVEDADEGTRYRLYETVRAYAAEKLRDAGEAERVRTGHRDWYLAWLCGFGWEEVCVPSDRAVEMQDAEFSNLRAALEWAADDGRSDIVVRMVGRMGPAWSPHFDDLNRWSTIADVEDMAIDPDERVAYLSAAAGMALSGQEDVLLSLADRAVAAAGDRVSAPACMALAFRAMVRGVLGALLGDEAEIERSRPDFARADDKAKELGGSMPAFVKMYRALAEFATGEIEQAAAELQDGLRVMDTDAYALYGAAYRMFLAGAAHLLGDHERAVAVASDAFSSLGTSTWMSSFAAVAAPVFAGAGDLAEARRILRAALPEVRRSGLPFAGEEAIIGCAAVAALAGDHTRASRLLAWVRMRTFEQGRAPRTPAGVAFYVHYVRIVRDALEADAAERHRDEGRAMSEDESYEYALEGLHDG